MKIENKYQELWNNNSDKHVDKLLYFEVSPSDYITKYNQKICRKE